MKAASILCGPIGTTLWVTVHSAQSQPAPSVTHAHQQIMKHGLNSAPGNLVERHVHCGPHERHPVLVSKLPCLVHHRRCSHGNPIRRKAWARKRITSEDRTPAAAIQTHYIVCSRRKARQ